MKKHLSLIALLMLCILSARAEGNVAPAAPESEATLLANIAALRDFTPTGTGTVKVTLDDVKVTYAGVSEDSWNGSTENVVLEDASAGYLLQNAGLTPALQAGQTLNGMLVLNVEVDELWGDVSYTASLAEAAITDGEPAPLEVTDDNVLDYLGNFSWRLVKFTGATVSVVAGEWGDEIRATIPVLGSESIGMQDTFGTVSEWPADGDVTDIVGYYVNYSIYGMSMQYIQPISFAKAGTPAVEEPSEAYISYDMSRVEGWAFPKYVITGTEIAIPYTVQTYMGSLSNVVVSLMVNGEVADRQEVGTIAFDEDFGEGDHTGKFTYTTAGEGELTFRLVLSYDGSALNEGENETQEVVIAVYDSAPSAPVMENIAALKAYETQGIEDVVLTLTDARVTYVGTSQSFSYDTWDYVDVDVVVFEDASAGIFLKGSGLGTLVSEGQALNGQLALSIESVWGETIATLTNGIEGVVAADGTVTPLELTDDNVLDYLAAPDWKLIELKDVTFKTVSEEGYGDELHIVSNLIGELGIMDALGTGIDYLADAEKADAVTGYVYSLYGGLITAFQPVSVSNLVTTGVDSVKGDSTAAGAPVWNLNGQRVQKAGKGLYIVNGKKVISSK